MGSEPVNGHGPKTVIVTGGASGIGLAMVEHFASQGHNIAVFDVNLEVGKQVVSSVAEKNPKAKVQFKKCDVSSWKNQAEAFKDVFNEFGRIDIVMANAGISEQGGSALASIEKDEPKEPNLKIMDVDLSGVIYSEYPSLETFPHPAYLNTSCQTRDTLYEQELAHRPITWLDNLHSFQRRIISIPSVAALRSCEGRSNRPRSLYGTDS